MTANINLGSKSFWSALGGIAAIVVGLIDPGNSLGTAIQTALVTIGGAIAGIVIHHNVKAEVAVKSTKTQ